MQTAFDYTLIEHTGDTTSTVGKYIFFLFQQQITKNEKNEETANEHLKAYNTPKTNIHQTREQLYFFVPHFTEPQVF